MDLKGSESFGWRSTVWHCTVLPGIEEAPFTRRLESPCPGGRMAKRFQGIFKGNVKTFPALQNKRTMNRTKGFRKEEFSKGAKRLSIFDRLRKNYQGRLTIRMNIEKCSFIDRR
ncbi:hypothetical protein V1478_007220 [Vespula squamosa]|uniref:Uncharacterized protein n=1 Tax=Vespula squamosa TaxID=30214 RepID=A0ABD2B2I6_VESSQ